MPDSIARQRREADLLDGLAEAQARLHVRRESLDLRIDGGVEGPEGPAHELSI